MLAIAAYHLDERTVMGWQERVGRHCKRVHEHLVEQPQDLEQVQADEMWVKAQGKVIWLAMALMVRTRLWLGGVVAEKRDEGLIGALMQIVRKCALAQPLLICVDGFSAYVQAVQRAFRSPLPTGKRVVDITRRMAQGCLETAQALLERSRGGTKLNTAFIERLNATFRSRLAVLVRRSRALIRNPQTLEPLVYLMGTIYNFCTEHKSLRLPGIVGGRKWIPRTPAIAAGLTDHIWTVKELLLFRIPPSDWQPPKHRGRRSQAEWALIARWCS